MIHRKADALLTAVYQRHHAALRLRITVHNLHDVLQQLQNRMGSHKAQRVVIYTFLDDELNTTKDHGLSRWLWL
jgi:hypothetical protein